MVAIVNIAGQQFKVEAGQKVYVTLTKYYYLAQIVVLRLVHQQ